MNSIKKIQKEIKEQNFFRDGWLLSLVSLSLLGDAFIIFWSVTHIQRASIELPVRFTSISNFDQLGSWFRLYEIAGIALVVTAINIFLAALLYRKNKILSIFLSIAALMVVILAIAILLGFTAIKYGTN